MTTMTTITTTTTRIQSLLLIFLLLSITSCSVDAQISFSCSDEGTAACSELNRVCRTVNAEEVCGPCVEGFVEFPESRAAVEAYLEGSLTEEELKELYVCTSLDKITTAYFLSYFQPIYTATANLSESERLEALLVSARIVSEFNRGVVNSTVELALNAYAADRPEDAAGLLGYQRPHDYDTAVNEGQVFVYDDTAPFPLAVDWRQAGAVTPVKNQGRCGCCWAISTVGALEGAAAITSNFTWLDTLAHQQLVSCDKAHKGCNGGFPAAAFDYADDQGVAQWAHYPYTDGATGETTKDCNLKGKPIEVEAGEGFKVNYYGNVGDDTYTLRVERLKYALSAGPVAVSVKSNCARLMLYRKGVLTEDADCKCGPTNDPCHDHAVLMVGYNDQDPVPYWIVKNSWGRLWGEQGYVRIAQLNPDDNEDSWGLFGVLGEGIIPKDVFPSQGKVFDKNERRPTWWKLMVACLAILGACVLALGVLYVKEHCFDNTKLVD